MYDMIYFQDNLSYLRSEKKLTLAMIYSQLGFTPSQWNNYEQGRSYPKFLDLIKIAAYFEVSESEIIHTELSKIKLLNKNSEITRHCEELSCAMIEIQNKLIQVQEDKIQALQKEIMRCKGLDTGN